MRQPVTLSDLTPCIPLRNAGGWAAAAATVKAKRLRSSSIAPLFAVGDHYTDHLWVDNTAPHREITPARDRDRTPLEVLQEGKGELSDVINAAASYGEHGA